MFGRRAGPGVKCSKQWREEQQCQGSNNRPPKRCNSRPQNLRRVKQWLAQDAAGDGSRYPRQYDEERIRECTLSLENHWAPPECRQRTPAVPNPSAADTRGHRLRNALTLRIALSLPPLRRPHVAECHPSKIRWHLIRLPRSDLDRRHHLYRSEY
jgi:hypothetical protein